jgi:hypothetical protein
LILGLRSGKIKVTDVPIIRVVEYEGKLFTLDNRRLAAFQNAGVKSIPIQRMSLNNYNIKLEFHRKLAPIEEGEKIVVIPGSSLRGIEEQSLRDYGKIR